MISIILGNEVNGIYTVANKLPTMLTLLSGVLMQAWQYSVISESKSSRQTQATFYSNVWLWLSAALFFVCSVMIALSKIEIRILADTAYYDAWKYVPVLCAAMLFCAFTSFMGSVYTVAQRTSLSFWTSLLGAGINIVLNAVFIPSPLGIQGAALATLASYSVVFLVRAGNVRQFIPFRLFKRNLLISTSVLAVQILFMSFAWPGWQGIQIGAVIVMLLIERKQLIEKYVLLRRRKGGDRDD